MTGDDAHSIVLTYWLEKSAEAVASADAEFIAGRLDPRWGRFYDRLFENRQRGDYQELVVFEAEQVDGLCKQAHAFREQMLGLLEKGESTQRNL